MQWSISTASLWRKRLIEPKILPDQTYTCTLHHKMFSGHEKNLFHHKYQSPHEDQTYHEEHYKMSEVSNHGIVSA